MAPSQMNRAAVLLALLAAFAGTALSSNEAPEAVGEVVRALSALSQHLENLSHSLPRSKGQGVPERGGGAHRGRALVGLAAAGPLVCPKKGCPSCPFGAGVCGSLVCCVQEASRVSCAATNQLHSICQSSPMKLSHARCKPVRDGLAAIQRLTTGVPPGLVSFCSGLSAQFAFLAKVSAQLTALQKSCCR